MRQEFHTLKINTNGQKLYEFTKQTLEWIEELNLKNGILKDKTFLFTGKLQGISRAEAKSLIEQNSGSIISNISRKLDYLIVGKKPTLRKVNTAKELQIKILSQVDWFKMLNKRS